MKRLTDIWYHLVSNTNNNLLYLLPHFQILICNYNELLVLLSFFFWPLKKFRFQSEILGNLFKYILIFLFHYILSFTSSSPCRKDQFAVSYFSTSLIVLIKVYNWEIQHHSSICWCRLADILYIFKIRMDGALLS